VYQIIVKHLNKTRINTIRLSIQPATFGIAEGHQMKDQSGINQELSEENAFLKLKIRKLKHPEADTAFFYGEFLCDFSS